MINKFGFYNQAQKAARLAPPPENNINHQKEQEGKIPITSQASKKQTYLRPEDYHPFQIPPSISLAQLHRRVTQFGCPSDHKILEAQEKDVICNCCGQQEKQILPICCESKKVYRINEAQGYYFTYIKIIIIALLSVFIIQGIFGLITTKNYCSSNPLDCQIVYRISLPQSIDYFTDLHNGLSILAGFLIFPFAIYLFYFKALMHEKLRHAIVKVSDFSTLITGIDFNKISDQQLVEKLGQFAVENILFTHQIGKYLPAMEKRFILEAKKNLYFKRGLTEKMKIVEQQINQISNIVLPFKNNMSMGNQRVLRTDKIIVKFRTIQQRDTFSKHYHVNAITRFYYLLVGSSNFAINDVPLYVESSGQPEEVIWQNLQYSSKYKFMMVIINTLVSAIILGVSLVIIVELTHLQNEKEQNNQIFISFSMAIVIELVNIGLYLAIYQLTQMEKRITLTGKMVARIIRNVLVFFFNTTLIPFSLFVLDWLNDSRQIIYEYIFTLFIVNNIISPFTVIFNPFNLYKIYCKRKIQQEGKDCLFTQHETNQIFQKCDFQLQLRYQLLSQRIMNCCFYAGFMPEVILITIAGLIIDYWIQKWWLLNHCCIPKYSSKLGNIINRITIFFPPVYLFGYLANIEMMKDFQNFPVLKYFIILSFSILSVIISVLIFITIKQILKQYVRKHQSLITNQNSICIKEVDYCDVNPTSFLHIDLKNRVNVATGKSQSCRNGFQKIQQFVLKRKMDALARRQTEGIRDSFLKEIKANENNQIVD